MRSERGSGTVVVGAAILAGCVLAGVLLIGGSYAAAVQQLRQAADLVAVSAADQGCSVADRVAADNHAAVKACTVHGDVFDYVVWVEVESRFELFGFGTRLTESAYAGELAR
jgi:secretion/DNA translocation related TadE-like protein